MESKTSVESTRLSTLGYLYSIFTLACSVAYVFILTEYTTNDHFWRNYNVTGANTFLADVINAKLRLGEVGDLDIFAPASLKDYSLPTTVIDVRMSMTRRAMTQPFSLEVAVMSYRANTLFENVLIMMAYCWVDFGHQFEMAHTAKRQLRCAKSYYDNAAVHLESLLRNVNHIDLAESSYGVQINQTILSAVTTIPGGSAWVNYIQNHEWGLSQEVDFWRSYGLTHYATQFQNRYQAGYLNRSAITNALGMSRSITISTVPFFSRSLSLWSTRYINIGWWTDMSKCVPIGATMIRNTNTSVKALGRNWKTIYIGSTTTVGGDIVRASIGPFMSWDTKLITPPSSLLNVIAKFHAQLYDRLRSDLLLSESFQAISESDIDVVPPT
ncbi:unnamed protein product [Aphanomyces euteiches]|uniref:Uncharacterized protein n=1 Tax=Aphanomyces euteiches TaxID=100861 RepID=A0A6G0XHS6_9STRA|nr:hypothetical protein Ae201684_004667 [Aphanomyces euteiches]KAH9073185.1 hypothetical protein Ae201684P_015002 [Aphanomyces euteiches]KAH9139336.1 hypothetical protein AeRB84_016359 [Aphanomyces euteiches]